MTYEIIDFSKASWGACLLSGLKKLIEGIYLADDEFKDCMQSSVYMLDLAEGGNTLYFW